MKKYIITCLISYVVCCVLKVNAEEMYLRALSGGMEQFIKELQRNVHDEIISEERKNELSIAWPYNQYKTVMHQVRAYPQEVGDFKKQIDRAFYHIDQVYDYKFRLWWFTQDRFTLFPLFDALLADPDITHSKLRETIYVLYGATLVRGVMALYVQEALNGNDMYIYPYLNRSVSFNGSMYNEEMELFDVEKERAFAIRQLKIMFAQDQRALLQELTPDQLFDYQNYARELALIGTKLDDRSHAEKSVVFAKIGQELDAFDHELKQSPDIAPCLEGGVTALKYVFNTLKGLFPSPVSARVARKIPLSGKLDVNPSKLPGI